MKTMMVLGAAGGMGSAIVKELARRGESVKAVVRSDRAEQIVRETWAAAQAGGEHAESDDNRGLSIVRCDVRDTEQLTEAARDCEVIFNSLGLPYSAWESGWMPLIDSIIQAASVTGARIVQVDNVYPYGQARTERVDENHPKEPHTRKGKIRLRMEQRLLSAHENGVPVLIVRFPDFYGPGATNSMLNMTLEGLAAGKTAVFVGDPTIPREFVYMEDGARAAVELAHHEDAYGENWHVPGAGTISGREIAASASEITGSSARLRAVGKYMISLLGLFSRDMREVVEMLYLTQKPVILNGDKYTERIGPLPQTDYRTGIERTLSWYRSQG